MFKIAKHVAGAGVVVAAGSLFGTGAAQAGQATQLEVSIEVIDTDAQGLLDEIEVEVYEPGAPPTLVGTLVCNVVDSENQAPAFAFYRYACGGLDWETDYILGLTGVPADMYLSVECIDGDQVPSLLPQDVLEPSDLIQPNFNPEDTIAECQVQVGGNLDVDASVVNDNGGTADPTDISVEVFDTTDPGNPVEVIAATPCAADGNCLNVSLEPGSYTLGYVGPDGYARTIDQSVADAPIENELLPQAIVTDDPDAEIEFPGEQLRLITIDIAADDPVPPTTTTTTTTTTTVAPTTTTTTTIAVPLAPSLPETGTSGGANAQIAAIAGGLVLLGGALVVGVSRRRI